MAINYEVWGTPETWATGASPYDLCDLKIGASGLRNLRQFWENGRLQLNTIDLSPMYYGIGKDSLLNKIYYIAPYISDGETLLSIEKVQDVDTDKSLIWSRTAPANNQTQYNWRWAEGRSDNVATNASAYNSSIALEYSYQKMILVPYVKFHTTGTNSASSTLYDYINNQTYLTRPEIISIGYKARLGSGNGTDRTLTTGLCPVINIDVPGKNLRYNNIEWYSHTGMKILQNAVGESEIVQFRQNSDLFVYVSKNNTVGDSITALAYKYCTTGNIYTYLYDPEQPFFKINKVATSGSTEYWQVYPYIECTAENAEIVRDYILKQIAFLGSPFVYDPNKGKRGQIGDEGVYLPVFNELGITTGEYEEGQNALALPNSEWIDARTGSGYDPYRPVPAGDLDNVTGRNLNFWSSNKYYLMRQEDLDEFLARVNGLYTGGDTAEEKAEELRRMQVDFKGSNPSDYIVGLYGIPFQWVWPKQFFQPVMLGPVEVLPNDSGSSTAVELVNPDSDAEMLFGEIQIPELGNFLDFEPYTTLMLYVPFCGTCKLDAAEYIGHTVRVVGTLDKHTGELAVRIMRDGLTVTNTMTGNLYVRVPVTAQAMGTYETNLHQLQMAAFNREFGLLTGAVTGGVSMGAAAAAGGEGEGGGGGMLSPTAPISMAANLIQLPIAMADFEFRITHCQPPVFYSSSASSANQAKFYRKAKLFIKRPVFLDTYNTDTGKYVYSHTVGYACCKQVEHINDMTSADHNHFIKCSNVCLTGIPATVEEINAIKQALCSGVYI